jgi:hypothetical protein
VCILYVICIDIYKYSMYIYAYPCIHVCIFISMYLRTSILCLCVNHHSEQAWYIHSFLLNYCLFSCCFLKPIHLYHFCYRTRYSSIGRVSGSPRRFRVRLPVRSRKAISLVGHREGPPFRKNNIAAATKSPVTGVTSCLCICMENMT